MLEKDAQELIKNKDNGKDFDEDFSYIYQKRYQRKDGGFTTVFEKFKSLEYGYEKDTPNPRALRTLYAYYYDDIMIFTYNVDGSLRWKYKIPRSQRFIDRDKLYGSSTIFFDNEDNIQIFYSENNWKKKSSDTQPILYTIDSTGNGMFYELFTKDENARKDFSPTMINRWDNGKYLFGQIHFPKFGRTGTYLTWGIVDVLSY